MTGGGGGGAMLGSVLVSVSVVTGAAGPHNGLEVSSARRWDEWLWWEDLHVFAGWLARDMQVRLYTL